MAIFLTVLPKAVFRAQPKVYDGAFLNKVNDFYLLTFFAKKPHHKHLTVFQKRLCCL